MLRVRYFLTALLSAAVLLCAYACAPAAPPYALMVPVEDIMAGIVDQAADVVFGATAIIVDADGIHEIRPANDDEWGQVGHSARALAEVGNILRFDAEHQEDADWQNFARALTESALAVADTADAKDSEGLLVKGGEMYEFACIACHEVYFPDDSPAFPR